MSFLILIRHGKSEWNEQGLWTGLTDSPLSAKGREEARQIAERLKGFKIDAAFSSSLSRAKETLAIVLKEINQKPPVKESSALNERDYGVFTGKNKWAIKMLVGPEEFKKIRRSWDYPIAKGESLKMVYARVVPYFEKEIQPKLKSGKNVLVSAHGNSLRALVKFLEKIPDEKIAEVEIETGEAWIYEIDQTGKIVSKTTTPPVSNKK
jgi:2,3-bisphosphoglycerate-dependent phosphoglycerate mutase